MDKTAAKKLKPGEATVRVLLDALRLDISKAAEISVLVRQAIRADSIANEDDYQNQLGSIRHTLGIGECLPRRR